MPSPFPGMDPFLEHPDFFPDLHGRFHVYLSEALQDALPPPYFAVINERLWVETTARYIEPDTDVMVGGWTVAEPSAAVADVLGVGGFRRWRHGSMVLETMQPEHPICLGLPAKLHLEDEPYWPPTPPLDSAHVQVLAGSREQTEPDQAAVSLQPMFWTYQRGPGRVFGCVLGHYSWTFDDPYFRLWLLRGMAWAAHERPYRFDDLALRSAAVAEN